MKLTIEELSKRTKLSIPTLRVYVSRQKLGTKIGNNRFFSQADVDKLMKGSKKSGGKGKSKAGARKAAPARKPRKAAAKKAPRAAAAKKPAAPVKPAPQPEKVELKAKAQKRSFWSRLFGGGRPAQKISLMQVKKR
jgi:DNA-binding transcriptional MerR regulator